MSFSQIFEHRRVRQLLTLLLVGGALACMFPPHSYTLKRWSSHAEVILLAYLALGILFFMLNNFRLMFVCFGCCATVSFYLLETSNRKIKNSKVTDMPYIKVAHFNVSNSEGEVQAFIETVRQRNADIVSLQELTPDWDSVLQQAFRDLYPYVVSLPKLSHGLCLYSRIQLQKIDTFYYKDIPNVSIGCRPEGFDTPIWVIASYITAPLSGKAYDDLKAHLEKISFYANKCTGPVVTVGEYNTVPWSKEMQDFRQATDLADTRRGVRPSQINGQFPLFRVPIDHILYSKDAFDCPSFETVSNAYSSELGIECVLQLKSKQVNSHESSAKRSQ